jgi:hypothetical protein
MGKTANEVGIVNLADRIFIRLAGLGLFLLLIRHVSVGWAPLLLYGERTEDRDQGRALTRPIG